MTKSRFLTVNATRLLVIALLLFNFGCHPATTPPPANQAPAAASSPQWDAFVNQYINDYFTAQPHVGVWAGRHEFDGRLPDWSEAGLQREIGRLRSAREQASGFADTALDERQRFERDYLIAQIDGDLFWLEKAQWPHRNPFFYAGALDPDTYVSREYAPLDARLRAYTAYARAVPQALTQARTNLRLPLPRTYVKIGRTSIGGLASFFERDVPNIFAPVTDQQLQADFRAANETAIRAIKEFDAWLAQQEASATDNFALGAEAFSEMLRATERVDVPLAQLEQVGRQDMERNLAALREACAAYAPGEAIPACIASARANKPEGGSVEAARQQLAELRAFLTERNLVTIPGTEEARVGEAPAYRRWNFAYINIPGPYETGLPSTYYISPPDPSWSEQQRRDYIPGRADLLFTSVHEVWPGHFLHFLHANRSPSKFGQVFVGYAFAEGWAHYTEEMMWEAGLGNGSPEIHIGQLSNALLRNARYLSAIGMHTGSMTVADSERLFREQAFQDAGTAQQQAARGTFDPAYLNYTMGKLMIRRLREDWTATRGGREAWRGFHDQFLQYGGPPIPLVRRAMMGSGDNGSLF